MQALPVSVVCHTFSISNSSEYCCRGNVPSISDFVSLSPGTRYSLALKTSRIHRLPFPHVSNCSNQYPDELNDIVPRGATYSNQNCMMLCFGKFGSSDHCNCTSPSFIEGQRENCLEASLFLLRNTNYNRRFFVGMIMGEGLDYTKPRFCQSNRDIKCVNKFMADREKKEKLLDTCKSMCQPECRKTKYEVKWNSLLKYHLRIVMYVSPCYCSIQYLLQNGHQATMKSWLPSRRKWSF